MVGWSIGDGGWPGRGEAVVTLTGTGVVTHPVGRVVPVHLRDGGQEEIVRFTVEAVQRGLPPIGPRRALLASDPS